MSVDQDPELKYGYEVGGFGRGLYGVSLPWHDTTPEEFHLQAMKNAWANGCPKPKLTIGESPVSAERMMRRYAEHNFMWRFFMGSSKELNPALYAQMKAPTPRWIDELVQPEDYEAANVPPSYTHQIAALSGLVGYGLSRLGMLRRRTLSHQHDLDQARDRAHKLAREVVATVSTPFEALADYADLLKVDQDIDPELILQYALPANILEEQHSHRTFAAFAAVLGQRSDSLAMYYHQLSPSERKELGIAEVRFS